MEGNAGQAGSFSVGEAPEWVIRRQFRSDNHDESDEPVVALLVDKQFRLDTFERFSRTVQLLKNATGVKQLSQLDLPFDPKTETMTVHSVTLWRDGEAIERIDPERFQLVQREQNLELQIYDGRLSALFLIEDVRAGDILDVSHTTRQTHAAHADHFFALTPMQWPFHMEEAHVSVLCPADAKLRWKIDPGDAEQPDISQVGDDILYHWSRENLEGITSIPNVPPWYPLFPVLQLTDYQSWEEVGQWIVELWKIQLVHPDLKDLVAQFQEGTDDPMVMARRAIDFVQCEIRYLGLEDGIGSFKPSAPAEVLRRRFGDCKDKSLLLSTLLRMMQIPAAPVLVSSRLEKSLRDHLPMPPAFDHVIVRLQVGGLDLWIDATDSHQRGPLEKRWPPGYGYGLQVHSKSAKLIPIPDSIPDGSMLRVREEYLLGAGERPAELEKETMARGFEASRIRAIYEAFGPKQFAEACEDNIKSDHPKAERKGDLRFVDNEEENTIEIREAFTIPEFTKLAGDQGHRVAMFTSRLLRIRLAGPPDKHENLPWPLWFPCNVRNRIRVTLPWRTNVEPERTQVDNDHFHFEFRSRQLNDKTVELLFGYDSHADHVPAEKFGRYRVDFERMANSSAYILGLDGAAGPSWDNRAVGGNPGAHRPHSREADQREYGRPASLAWAGGGTVVAIFVWLVIAGLRFGSRTDSDTSAPAPSTPSSDVRRAEDIMRRLKLDPPDSAIRGNTPLDDPIDFSSPNPDSTSIGGETARPIITSDGEFKFE